jgi:hypothetical protein
VPAPTLSFLANYGEVAGYPQVCGILATGLAIAGFLVPVIWVLFITPLAIVVNAIALYGGYRRVTLVTVVIVLVNLMVSRHFGSMSRRGRWGRPRPATASCPISTQAA